jgi:hypothetical protein
MTRNGVEPPQEKFGKDVHYRVNNSAPNIPILSRMKPVHVLKFYSCNIYCNTSSLSARQWRTEGVVWGVQTPPKFRNFDKAEPNSQFRGKYIINSLKYQKLRKVYYVN